MTQSIHNDLSPSPLALGTMEFGGRADEAASAAMFEAAYTAGIRHFDTAHLYTGGQSERFLGQFIRTVPDAIIATKIGYSGGAGAENLGQQFELSTARLNREKIDLLYLHRYDPDTPLEESLSFLAKLQAEGRIGAIGLSNFAAWQVMKAEAIARRLGTRIAAIQPMYSLLKRQAEVELLPMAQDQNMRVFSYSPLAAGLLTGKYHKAESAGRLSEDPRYAARYQSEAIHASARAFNALAADWGIDPVRLAVAWAMHHPARPVPLIAGRSRAQITPSLAALSLTLTPEMRETISAIGPTPGLATDRSEEISKALPSQS